MRAATCMLLVLLASVCVAQTRANFFDKIKDKITGGDDEPKRAEGNGEPKPAEGNGEPKPEGANVEPKPEVKKEEKEEDHDSYEGGLLKQVAHTMVDAAVDRLAVEAKDQYGNPLLKPVISIAAGKVKDKIHDTINDYGVDKEAKPEEAKPEAPAAPPAGEGEKKDEEEKKGGLAGLIEKVTKRRKRGIVSGIANYIRGEKVHPEPANTDTTPEPEPESSGSTTRRP